MTELVEALVAAGYDDTWIVDGDIIKIDGEHADGCPSWTITRAYDWFNVERALGWYEQTGEARCIEGLIKLMNAMDKASATLDKSLAGAGGGILGGVLLGNGQVPAVVAGAWETLHG